MRSVFRVLLTCSLLLLALPALVAQDDLPPAPIENDEGSVQVLVGQAEYLFPAIDFLFDDPQIALVDVANYVLREYDRYTAQENQILGSLTSDFFTSPFSYRIPLPLVPQAEQVDVDNDGEADPGVMIWYATAAQDYYGEATLDEIEQASIFNSLQLEPLTLELTSAQFLVWAPDDQQGFPAGWGADGLMFTEDDPLVRLPQGYTLVTMPPTSPDGAFTFDRSREATITIEQIQTQQVPDFSQQGILESYENLITYLNDYYAFTEFVGIEWYNTRAELLPRVQAADAENDIAAYFDVLFELQDRLNDSHASVNIVPNPDTPQDAIQRIINTYLAPYQANLGFAVAELDDGRIVVTDIAEGGPAAEAGIAFGSELLRINGEDLEAVIARQRPLLAMGADSLAELRRKNRIAASVQFAPGAEVTLEYRLPGADETQSATLTAGLYDVQFDPDFSEEMALRYETLDGYGYASWKLFGRPSAVSATFDDFITQMNQNGVPGIILDLRGNIGGSGVLMNVLRAYLFTQDAPYIETAANFIYSESAGEFVRVPEINTPSSAPQGNAYTGEVVVLVNDGCASACEFFADSLQRSGRATVIGQYPTSGAGGGTNFIPLPAGLQFQFSISRLADAETGEPTIQATGVQPDVRVPVTLETIAAQLAGEDPVLQAAIAHLDDALTPASVDSSSIPDGFRVVTPGLFALSAAVPDGWTESGPGAYNAPDGTALALVQSLPLPDVQQTLDTLREQGVIGAYEIVGSTTVNERDWQIVETSVSGIGLTLALTNDETNTYLLGVGAPGAGLAALENDVLPVLIASFSPAS